jgi:quinol monooxygenase YgiN
MAIGMLGAALASIRPAAAAPNSGAVYRVTYFEAAAPDIGKVGVDVRQFAAASRNEAGNAGFEAFQEIARPSRFAIVEAWQDKASADAHNTAAATVAFRNQAQPLLGRAVGGPHSHRVFDRAAEWPGRPRRGRCVDLC